MSHILLSPHSFYFSFTHIYSISSHLFSTYSLKILVKQGKTFFGVKRLTSFSAYIHIQLHIYMFNLRTHVYMYVFFASTQNFLHFD